MSTFEIILSVLTSTSIAGNVAQFITLRAQRKKSMAEANKENDSVLYKRIEFLDERVTRLEQLAFDISRPGEYRYRLSTNAT